MSPQAIAHYRITAKLGEGGMGEVYRATDTKLGRDVAIKVISEAFSQDADRMARFTREAQVLASLNHPSIAAIYGVEERALVMELVEGLTLAERIAHGPIPLPEALPLAQQIAEALEYAHERGIIHRDLKPANIKITADGRVKVLDFGLAKALSNETAAGDRASSPTLTMRATAAGVILGTPAYMAPEQTRGMPADKRADIWAFGVVLFEMLTGRQMFSGHTISDTLAAVLRADPDWSTLPPETPTAIRRLLRRCLERELKRRMCDIGDARLEIEEALMAPPESSPVTTASLARGDLRWWFGGVILLALAGAAVTFVHFREAPPERAEVRFQVPPPEKSKFAAAFRLALSPDGRRLAFAGLNAEGRQVLWVHSLDSLDARPLPGTENAVCAFWSPDSRWIAFAAEGKLKKIEASGGQTQTLCNTPPAGGISGAWNRDGVILFGTMPSGGGLLRVSQAGGEATRATTVDRSETAHAFPQFLPDGRHFIYLAFSKVGENTGIYLGALGGKERKRLLSTTFSAVYSPASANSEKGHLLFLRDGTLMAQPLDARTLDLAGEAFPIAEQIGNYLSYGYYSAATNGALAYRSGGRTSANTQLMWFNREGKPLGAVGPLGGYNDLALSRDGKRVAVSQDDPQPGKRDIWLLDVARGVPQRFTFGPREDWCPVWSPDGRRLFFASRRDGPDNIYQKDSGGTGTDEPLLKSGLAKNPLDWSPDGRFLMYYVEDPKTKADLWILPAGGDRKPMPFLQTPFNETQGQFSPGSEGAPAGAPRWVAYSSDESGAWQIYVQPFPGGTSGRGGKFQVSTGGGLQPRWRADGKELFYIAPDGKLMAVEVKMSPKFETGIPKALFTTRISGGTTSVHVFRYAVAPDGKRFLINTMPQTDEPNASPITVVLNWTAGLKK